jgi:pimeloyl-ACP methyl ester carboxylesterase
MLNYEVEGVGEPVVLLHSGVCDLRQWDPQWAGLTSRFRTVRIDLTGFGRSPCVGAKGQDAGEVLAVLDELEIEMATVIGSSHGGRVAQEIVMLNQERIAKLILICAATNGISPTPSVIEYGDKEDFLVEAGKFDEATTLNVETWLGPDASAETKSKVWSMQRNAFDVQSKNPTHQRLRVPIEPAQIACPAVIITGSHDFDFFEVISDHLASLIPQSTRIQLGWAGHLPNLERPAEFEELLTSLILN